MEALLGHRHRIKLKLRKLKRRSHPFGTDRWQAGPYDVKISRGRKAETMKLGTSTTSLSFRSTATLQIQ